MKAPLTLLLLTLAFSGCEREPEPSIYRPGGPYHSVLDARGKRIIVRDHEGEVLGKWRERDESIRIYGPDMILLGEVSWDEAGDRVEVVAQGAEPAWLAKTNDGVWRLPGRLRLERVSNGWGIFDAASRRLGYVAEVEPGKFALRDDYSSAPRAFARREESSVMSPAGAVVVDGSPATNAVRLLPFAIDGLDNLTRAALATWLLNAEVADVPLTSDGLAPCPRPDGLPCPP